MGALSKRNAAPPKVLAIGDDAEFRRGLRRLLAAVEIGLVEAGDGATGLRAFYDERPDLVVLDLGLPDGERPRVLATDPRAQRRG